jgi:glycosyltransferase involved in cell wall biosynthesis
MAPRGDNPAVVGSLPDISVVVPSHDRPLRLRWLLNALETQTLSPERFEVVVGHDSRDPETGELLRSHPLARAGRLRHTALPPGSAPPGANRNAALSLARAPLVAFTDDDCRPAADWLSCALTAAERHPGSVVQGETRRDPEEWAYVRAPFYVTQDISPPTPWGEACNVVYPRSVLEGLSGFDPTMETGEDADLFNRAVAAGVDVVAAPEVLVYHAVHTPSLRARVRGAARWRFMPELVRRHPALRDVLPLRLFWKPRHATLLLALLGFALRRHLGVLALALAIPWAVQASPRYGRSPRGLLRAVTELPAQAAIDMAELLALSRGSIEHRSLLL